MGKASGILPLTPVVLNACRAQFPQMDPEGPTQLDTPAFSQEDLPAQTQENSEAESDLRENSEAESDVESVNSASESNVRNPPPLRSARSSGTPAIPCRLAPREPRAAPCQPLPSCCRNPMMRMRVDLRIIGFGASTLIRHSKCNL